LEALLNSRHEVVAVLTRPDAPAGRGRALAPSPVAARAAEAGIEVLRPGHPREPEFADRLARIAPDCAPVVAYGALLPASVLDVPRHGWVNLHFSLLPAWRGAAPVQHALLHGDEITGASVFQIGAGLDDGPVYGVLTEQVRPTDTSGDLLERLAVNGAGLLSAVLDGIEEGTLVAVPQPTEGVSLAPKLRPEDARVDWNAPALRVERQIRACTPAPGAWTTFRGERLKLFPARPVPSGADALAAGTLAVDRDGVRVGTGGETLLLTDVQPQGKRRMAAADWARGVRPGVDERLV
jgi:methionyl-tRNA formyltransferase